MDWNKQDVLIARETGAHPAMVRYYRLKFGFPSPNKWNHANPNSHWKGKLTARLIMANADWSLQDIALAEIYGVTRERARQIRVLLGKPKAANHQKKRDPARREAQLKKAA